MLGLQLIHVHKKDPQVTAKITKHNKELSPGELVCNKQWPILLTLNWVTTMDI